MELHVIIEGGRDLSEQVYSQIHQAVRSGRLSHGQQLPPTRLLARQLGISRKPVAEAYTRLAYDRVLVAQTGRGTFVGERCAAPARPVDQVQLASRPVLDKWARLDMPPTASLEQGGAEFDFACGAPATAHFPQEAWRRCILHGLRQESLARGGDTPAEGVPELRQAIMRHAGYTRGVRCTARQVVVSNGAQQALDLLARVLMEPGDVVALEEPGSPLVRALFHSHGARVVGVPVDRDGIIVQQIPDTAKLIYVTPEHQFPLGMAMSAARRTALLARALEIGAIIVEDDYDSEFRYEGRPVDCLQSMDTHGLVVFLGAMSKLMLPGLRLGYLVAPDSLLQALTVAKRLSDRHSASMPQYALAKFIDDGDLARHVRRGQAIYACRRDALLRGLAAWLGPWFQPVPAGAGLHLAALACQPVDMALLTRLARRAGVGLCPLAVFYAGEAPRDGLFFGFGAVDTLDIDTALSRLRDILLRMEH